MRCPGMWGKVPGGHWQSPCARSTESKLSSIQAQRGSDPERGGITLGGMWAEAPQVWLEPPARLVHSDSGQATWL